MTAEARITLAPLVPTGDSFPVRALRMDRGLTHPVGRAEALLPAGVTPPEAGARLVLSAIAGGAEVRLMTGDVARIAAGLDGTRLTLLDPVAALADRAGDMAISASTAGQVISGMCSDADVPLGTVLPGVTIPHMVLTRSASHLDHALRLARLSGMALASGSDGSLSTLALALPVPGGLLDTARAALRRDDLQDAAAAGGTLVTGSGAMGASGPGMTTLPLADPGLMQAGDAAAPRHIRAAALRMAADVMAAQMAHDARQPAGMGALRLTTPLPEDIAPGDVLSLPDASGLPTRLARLESVGVTLSARQGLLADYAFSDIRVAA